MTGYIRRCPRVKVVKVRGEAFLFLNGSCLRADQLVLDVLEICHGHNRRYVFRKLANRYNSGQIHQALQELEAQGIIRSTNLVRFLLGTFLEIYKIARYHLYMKKNQLTTRLDNLIKARPVLLRAKLSLAINRLFSHRSRKDQTKGGTLVVCVGGIGDVIMTMPALRALRRHLEEEPIDVLVRRDSREILQHCPYIDRLIIYPTIGSSSLQRDIDSSMNSIRGDITGLSSFRNPLGENTAFSTAGFWPFSQAHQ